jgi:hypothetical protein
MKFYALVLATCAAAFGCSYDWTLAAPADGGTGSGGAAGGGATGGSAGTRPCEAASCVGQKCQTAISCGQNSQIECCTGTNACALPPGETDPQAGRCVPTECLAETGADRVICDSPACPIALCDEIDAKCCSGRCVALITDCPQQAEWISAWCAGPSAK